MLKIDDSSAMSLIAGGGTPAQEAMAVIYERHFDRLIRNLRLAYPRLSEADAADFVGQGFVNAFLRANSYRGECALQTWLLKIARNLVIDAARHNAVAPVLGVDDCEEALAAWDSATASEDPLQDAMERQLVECVRQQFQEFRRRHPQPAWALWARLGEEIGPEDIALILDKTYGATRQYLSDWAKRLRQALSPCLPHL